MGTDVTRRLNVGEIQAASNREVMTASYLNRHALVAEARRQHDRGLITIPQGSRPRWSDEQQQWWMVVYRSRTIERPRISKKVWSTALILFGVAAIIAAGAWFLTALSMTALATLCLAALVALYLIVGAGRSRVEVTTITHTRVR